MASGHAGTSGKPLGAGGGQAGTSGGRRRAVLGAGIAGILGYSALIYFSNVTSKVEDFRRAGADVDTSRIWMLEATSFIAWFITFFFIWWAVARFRPPRLSWPVTIAAHIIAAVVASLLHIGLMFAFRAILFAALYGEQHLSGGNPIGTIVYEMRKDVATYALVAGVFALMQWLIDAPERGDEKSEVLEIADGAKRHHVPLSMIDHVAAAGNYVELAIGERVLMYRSTLAAMEGRLGAAGFVRIHRSRIVRRDAIRSTETLKSGDFVVTLGDGSELRGSRRYRDALGS